MSRNVIEIEYVHRKMHLLSLTEGESRFEFDQTYMTFYFSAPKAMNVKEVDLTSTAALNAKTQTDSQE